LFLFIYGSNSSLYIFDYFAYILMALHHFFMMGSTLISCTAFYYLRELIKNFVCSSIVFCFE